ncbi:hypothetical protein T36_1564 [Helicobacter cinaedi]|nr:hypothetical protein T36_1564 [Helicobacter cinaedi]
MCAASRLALSLGRFSGSLLFACATALLASLRAKASQP